MKKERIQQMAEDIKTLKEIVHPMIMNYSMEEWTEIRKYLVDRGSTIDGAAVIFDAMGDNSEVRSLKARFQETMFEGMFQYAKKLNEADKISKKIKETRKLVRENREFLRRCGF